MLPVIGLAVGIALGLVFDPTVPVWLQPYLPIAVVAALDAVCGGGRARRVGCRRRLLRLQRRQPLVLVGRRVLAFDGSFTFGLAALVAISLALGPGDRRRISGLG